MDNSYSREEKSRARRSLDVGHVRRRCRALRHGGGIVRVGRRGYLDVGGKEGLKPLALFWLQIIDEGPKCMEGNTTRVMAIYTVGQEYMVSCIRQTYI